MLPEEAVWFGHQLARFANAELSPIINLGSSTASYRRNACSEIEQYVFTQLTNRRIRTLHVDMKADEGVDIVGNVCEPVVQELIRTERPRAILCNNIIEHVPNRTEFVEACAALLPPDGLLFVSVPYKYPYHPDPIDTGYRPDLTTLRTLFPAFDLSSGEIIVGGNYLRALLQKRWLVVRDAYLLLTGTLSPNKLQVLAGNYRFLFAHYQVSCAVLRKRRNLRPL